MLFSSCVLGLRQRFSLTVAKMVFIPCYWFVLWVLKNAKKSMRMSSESFSQKHTIATSLISASSYKTAKNNIIL